VECKAAAKSESVKEFLIKAQRQGKNCSSMAAPSDESGIRSFAQRHLPGHELTTTLFRNIRYRESSHTVRLLGTTVRRAAGAVCRDLAATRRPEITQGRRSNLMWNVRSSAKLAAVAAADALILAACGGGDDDSGGGAGGTASGFNLSTTTIVNPSDRTGGTLKLGAGADCDS
jgi:hypothetical protein